MEVPASILNEPVFLSPFFGRIKLAAWNFITDLKSVFKSRKWAWVLTRMRNRVIRENEYLPVRYLSRTRVWVCPRYVMDRNIAVGRTYEPEVQRVISSYVKSGFSYLDVGANIGLHLIAAANNRISEDQWFVGIEPEPNIFKVLRKNMETNNLDFVKILECALSQSCGKSKLYISPTHNKAEHSMFPSAMGQTAIDVDTHTLGSMFGDMASDSLLMKLDVEGSESTVIRGGMKLLSTLNELAIIVEIHPAHLKRADTSPSELLGLLNELKCNLFLLEESRELPREEDLSMTLEKQGKQYVNLLAVKGYRSLHVAKTFCHQPGRN